MKAAIPVLLSALLTGALAVLNFFIWQRGGRWWSLAACVFAGAVAIYGIGAAVYIARMERKTERLRREMWHS